MKKGILNFFGGALMLSLVLSSCKEEDAPLPPIGGFNSSSEVGKSDLLAYWPLNGDGKESISNTAPSKTVGATFVTAAKGQGVKLTAGYLDFPSIPALAITGGSITVSCWAKINNTKLTENGTSTISPLISFSGGVDALTTGNLSIFGNTHGLTTNDTIQLKAQFRFLNPTGGDFGGDCVNMTKKESWMDDTHSWDANKIGGKWAHIVYVYDGTNANNRLYVNGIKISNKAWESRNNGVAMPMKFYTPTRPTIGATASVAEGTNKEPWNAATTGEIDEIRVWKKVLSLGEIESLYQLEKAGR